MRSGLNKVLEHLSYPPNSGAKWIRGAKLLKVTLLRRRIVCLREFRNQRITGENSRPVILTTPNSTKAAVREKTRRPTHRLLRIQPLTSNAGRFLRFNWPATGAVYVASAGKVKRKLGCFERCPSASFRPLKGS